MLQHRRELITEALTLDYLVQKATEGWKLAAIEWVREAADTVLSESAASLKAEEIPYGLRLSEDGCQLEQNPLERTVLLLILERIVQEKRITDIAIELNSQSLSTRRGAPWSPSAVFDLLPRLIEAGPGLLKSTEWENLRNRPSTPN